MWPRRADFNCEHNELVLQSQLLHRWLRRNLSSYCAPSAHQLGLRLGRGISGVDKWGETAMEFMIRVAACFVETFSKLIILNCCNGRISVQVLALA
jgi:hypothetical protein